MYSMLQFRKGVKTYYFPVLFLIALTVYVSQQLELYVPRLVNNYLNDLLCIPIVLKICLYVLQFVKSDKNLRIPISAQLAITLLFIVYFEFVLPEFSSRYIFDILDIMAYATGLFLFRLVEDNDRIKNDQ